MSKHEKPIIPGYELFEVEYICDRPKFREGIGGQNWMISDAINRGYSFIHRDPETAQTSPPMAAHVVWCNLKPIYAQWRDYKKNHTFNEAELAYVAVKVKDEAIMGTHIQATLNHDAGAHGRCSYCGRYSINPGVLNGYEKCDCGKKEGWSGSFKKPTKESKWNGISIYSEADQNPISRELGVPGGIDPEKVPPKTLVTGINSTKAYPYCGIYPENGQKFFIFWSLENRYFYGKRCRLADDVEIPDDWILND